MPKREHLVLAKLWMSIQRAEFRKICFLDIALFWCVIRMDGVRGTNLTRISIFYCWQINWYKKTWVKEVEEGRYSCFRPRTNNCNLGIKKGSFKAKVSCSIWLLSLSKFRIIIMKVTLCIFIIFSIYVLLYVFPWLATCSCYTWLTHSMHIFINLTLNLILKSRAVFLSTLGVGAHY